MTAEPRSFTVAEFLQWESTQPDRHEFSDGVVPAFAGGTKRHALLARELSVLRSHLRGTGCEAFGSDALVMAGAGGRHPDGTITDDERDLRDLSETTIEYPKLIVE